LGGKIPRPIVLQVIRKWLAGISRDKIAQELQISTGAVSGIIKDLGKDDPEFDLLREVALKVKNQNLDIGTFAPLVRLTEVLREKGLLTGITGQGTLELMQNRLEAIVVDLEVFFFREHLSLEDFVSLVTRLYNTADKLGIPLDKFPAYITELEARIDALTDEMNRLETRKKDALEDYGLTLELLQEYSAHKPFVIQMQGLKKQIPNAEAKLGKSEQELENERFWNKLEEKYTWSISEDELNKANMEVGFGLFKNTGDMVRFARDLKEIVMDAFYHPSRYAKAIIQMRDIHNLQHKEEEQSSNTQ
jgi:hypothetical protein